ncbi:hypothetical protein [Dyadobacter sediminis]|uniref:Uncharacterized protein n=1 Tax=Dyadobacter sediminis TaxID=1493691 RepID=A0A5R9KBT2_9BACT|nr:hypothetical protein [Dyadobacter sediminis]TLU92293.1 hypothetical protein FEM55_16315 [Dyadobacter sediminis]GGB95699.1 hypothetical protein GCM10011325_23820 [Dyadobacter sediminis]
MKKSEKQLAANISSAVHIKLDLTGEQSEKVEKAIRKSAKKLAKKLLKIASDENNGQEKDKEDSDDH